MAVYNHGSTANGGTTGAANTPTTLWSAPNLAGGTVGNDDPLRVRLDASLNGGTTGSVWVEVNGVEVFRETIAVAGSRLFADIEVWRTGSTTGDATANEGVFQPPSSNNFGAIAPRSITGLAWGSSQTIVVRGQSDAAGGLKLNRAGIAK